LGADVRIAHLSRGKWPSHRGSCVRSWRACRRLRREYLQKAAG
jgi:hypothetical protein